jgi:hypothetical protein
MTQIYRTSGYRQNKIGREEQTADKNNLLIDEKVGGKML